MSKHTFSIRKAAGLPETEFTIDKPDSVDSDVWKDMISGDVLAAINDLAFKQWKVYAQAAYRGKRGVKPTEYVYGAAAVRGPVIDASTFPWPADKELAREQYQYMLRQGTQFSNTDDLPF